MAENLVYVTQESFDKMCKELNHLKSVERPSISKAIAEAREKGDLKENAEYDSAKEAQGMLEAKINYLEGTIANTKIIKTDSLDTSKVTILSKVTVHNLVLKKSYTYHLVGETEADLQLFKISANSPIGKGLMGKSVGDIAEIQTPAGLQKLQIENISI